MDAVEAKGGDVEHKHEYKELHDRYLRLFEEELSDFIEPEGATTEGFFRECRDIMEGNYTALFSDKHQYKWFVEHLVASMDYNQFYALMANEARRLSRSGAGQLGLGDTEDYALPQRYDDSSNATNAQIGAETVRSGGCHSAGKNADSDTLFVWGDNEKGQLGVDPSSSGKREVTRPVDNPIVVLGLSSAARVRRVACGWSHTVAIYRDLGAKSEESQQEDVIVTWGAHEHHQLGRAVESRQQAFTPTPIEFPVVHGKLRVHSIACGWKHSLLATEVGEVYAWGSGRNGELGLGDALLTAQHPTLVNAFRNEDAEKGATKIKRVLCGWQHSVFHASNGEVFACGSNRHGQLGRMSAIASKKAHGVPLPVLDTTTGDGTATLVAKQIEVGWHFVLCIVEARPRPLCGVATGSEQLVAWGKGSHGQLGLGDWRQSVAVPTHVPFTSETGIREIACGSEHTLVLTKDGKVFSCGWGEHGNLGMDRCMQYHVCFELVLMLFVCSTFFQDRNLRIMSVAAGGAVSIARKMPPLMI
ncbi:Regulator of chromosome condensation, partial [Globisporangium splendens]